ncbi:hypothetical protein JG687_00005053 [Phytophthora cactorum]|uniref:Protein kinase domain-containing protein n=1 Tax=Phytophthora cactorum TaxID=29920 RepID=A0A8T1UM32_9STRA|nr:hypothetical protein PC120_g817 [Phytophthora cactorum]KAG3099289.1 hypothetical protein PC121_g1964 [Phytophthora cactorum]KAG3198915.1 hypothetical protein PC128_g5686 [Phytophthora cactorum]KAG4063647.1 hypothetical protein PC123_g1502 [Phytophthora cactorum]KAG6966063.1 hypothetical protein JG687_00005053 [Phytophthora cactorum]
MQDDDRGREADGVETFKLPVTAEKIALGRLGGIYKALDRKTGRMIAVECIDVVDTAEVVQQVLEAELKHCSAITSGDIGRHVFCYDSVICSQSLVYLRSPSSVVGSLASLQKDFERLHPLAVKQYIYHIVLGLHELHEAGIPCGGLSLSSVLLCGGNMTKIAAWFPSAQAMNTLQSQEILSDSQFHRSSFSLQVTNDELAQDVRSVAYVMVEMLTGLRVHGSLMEKSNLLSKVATGSPEHQFLSSLLALMPLSELLVHPYFSAVNPTHYQVSETTQEQRHIVGILTNQELLKCQTMKRQYRQQIRAWQAQFEKKYRRKPNSADRPGGIVRLQGRSQALKDRMEELNNRLTSSHGSIYQMIVDKEALAIDASSQSVPTQHEEQLMQKNLVDGTTGSPVASEGSSRSDSLGQSGGNRSPAQKAFLNRFGSPQ